MVWGPATQSPLPWGDSHWKHIRVQLAALPSTAEESLPAAALYQFFFFFPMIPTSCLFSSPFIAIDVGRSPSKSSNREFGGVFAQVLLLSVPPGLGTSGCFTSLCPPVLVQRAAPRCSTSGCKRSVLPAASPKANGFVKLKVLIGSLCLEGLEVEAGWCFGAVVGTGAA